jgi:putative transposase
MTHAHGADSAPPIDRTDLLRAPGHGARKSRAPSTGGCAEANGHPSTPPLDGSTVLDPLGEGWRDWRSALIVVQPDTVVRWHRQWLRRRWTRRSERRRTGRPTTDSAIRALVSTMTATNPLWGAPRIHGELAKLGITLSERTVSQLLRPRRSPSQTWRTFLTNHVDTLVSMDFFTVSTLTGRVLFVLVLLAHQRRRIIYLNVTEHPTAVWTAQQMIEAFPADTAPRWLLRDRDAIDGDPFRWRVASIGIGEVISSPSSPWQNPYAARLIGSIRRECLDHVIASASGTSGACWPTIWSITTGREHISRW